MIARPRSARTILAAGAAVLSLAGAAYATTTLTAGRTAPQADLGDDAHGIALFNLSGLSAGHQHAGCITVRNDGPDRTSVSLYGEREDGGLADHLQFSVIRGRRTTAAPAGSCDGFEADTASYRGQPGVIFSGTLAAYPASPDRAIADPNPAWAVGEEHTYRLAVRVAETVPASATLTQTFSFGGAAITRDAPPQPPADAPTATTGPQTPGDAGIGDARGTAPSTSQPTRPTIACPTVTVRPAGRRKPSSGKRTYRLGGGVALRLRTKPQATFAIALVGPPAARARSVSAALNGERVAVDGTRPFRLTIPSSKLRLGRNVLALRVARAGRAPRTRKITLRATPLAGSGCALTVKEARR